MTLPFSHTWNTHSTSRQLIHQLSHYKPSVTFLTYEDYPRIPKFETSLVSKSQNLILILFFGVWLLLFNQLGFVVALLVGFVYVLCIVGEGCLLVVIVLLRFLSCCKLKAKFRNTISLLTMYLLS